MKKLAPFLSIILLGLGCSPSENNTMVTEPIARKVPKRLEIHGDVRIDPYFWMNDRNDPVVIDYLNKENDYREFVMKGTEGFQKSLYDEMVGRLIEDDSSVPYKKNGYFYYTRFEKDKQYPIICRKKETLEAPEEILLNVNELAEGKDYFQVGSVSISPDNQKIAFSVDEVSRRIYKIYFKDLVSGEILQDSIPNVVGDCVWAADNQTVFYSVQNLETLRSCKVKKHVLGSPVENDILIFEEKDDTYYVGVSKTKSSKYIIIHSSSTLSDEIQYLDVNTPNAEFTLFQERIRGLEYSIDHAGDHWYIRSNSNKAKNFKLSKATEQNTLEESWIDVIPHRENVFLEDVDVFKNFIVSEERENGESNLIIRNQKGDIHKMPVSEQAYTLSLGSNVDYDTEWLRYNFTSLKQPNSVIDYNMSTGEQEVKKVQEVKGGYDAALYESKTIWAPARDGEKVAISLVYRKDMLKEGENPLLLYAYGSYGYTIDPTFNSARLTLIDRGFVFAIAHIRGGQYLGRDWYEKGKLLYKKNTFTDFVDCSKFLVKQGYTSSEKLFAMGGSAGGLLMGAVLNMEPTLYKGVIAAVPFVDVVTTMLDETIPLTTGEFDEWGNPKNETFYNYMKEYSPYDNVTSQKYPAILVTTGLHDSQVQYWEPAKWVAKLRDKRTDKTVPLLMYCNMETGHGGASGRYEAYKEIAMEYAFMLDLLGISK